MLLQSMMFAALEMSQISQAKGNSQRQESGHSGLRSHHLTILLSWEINACFALRNYDNFFHLCSGH